MKFPKHSVSTVTLSSIILALANTTSAQTIERSGIPYAVFNAPLPVAPYKITSLPSNGSSPFRTQTKNWGYGLPGEKVIPSIPFLADDNKGISPDDMCGTNFPKHLGTDYAAPAGTNVYAIADGIVRRVNFFSSKKIFGITINVGDHFVVVESGSNDRWTTLYGHLNTPAFAQTKEGTTKVKKGDLIGTLFNYRENGDVPHLHLGIRLDKYDSSGGINASTRGYACQDLINANSNYKFTSPEVLRYITNYW